MSLRLFSVLIGFAFFSPSAGAQMRGIVQTTPKKKVVLNYAGVIQNITVPPWSKNAIVKMWGAGGAGGSGGSNGAGGPGGGGGYLSVKLSVNPGSGLSVWVGGGGLPTAFAARAGTGGGYSGVFLGGVPLAMVGSGGGGGAAGGTSASTGGGGGAGGGAFGQSGATAGAATGGVGGTTSAGGAAGSYSTCVSTPLFPTQGLKYDDTSSFSGASGGEGGQCTNGSQYYEDGGIPMGGPTYFKDGAYINVCNSGGGGSGYWAGGAGGVAAGTTTSCGGGGGGGGYFSGPGVSNEVPMTGSGPTPANPTDTDRGSAGQGGAGGPMNGFGAAGSNGLVVIYFY